MDIWYFVIGFIVSQVVLAIVHTVRFLRTHRISVSKRDESASAEALAPSDSTEIASAQAAAGELTPTSDAGAKTGEPELEDSEPTCAEPLDMPAFGRRLAHSDDVIAELMDFVKATREQESKFEIRDYIAAQFLGEFADEPTAEPVESAAGSSASAAAPESDSDDQDLIYPDVLSLYLCRELEEAGLFDEDTHFPHLTLVRPSRSRVFYLRVNDDSLAWGDMLRICAIEGALNRALFAWEHFVKDAPEAAAASFTMAAIYRFNQALAHSITAQVGSEPIARASMSDVLGEWGVRQAIASGIESFRLPLRLAVKYRLNLMGGDAAFVVSYNPPLVQPGSVYSEELGRIVDATSDMRARAAADYAMRCALLLASHAFRCSKRLCHVFVAFTLDTPDNHACVLSGDIAREDLRAYDLTQSFDAPEVCRELGMRFKLKGNALQVVEQGFTLDSERFCPRSRYEGVDLSARILPRFEAKLLGATKVSDLAINENAHRDEVAQQLVRLLTGTTTKDVHRILEFTQNDADESVQDAGQRLAARLIEGTLQENDVYALTQEFVFGDKLSRSCEQALELLDQDDAAEAAQVLTDCLAPLDALDVYRDTPTVQWRQFSSYVGRALYNRLYAKEGVEVRLVPDAYYTAQLLQASAQLELGHIEMALSFARRAQELNPFDLSPLLRVVRCYEMQGQLEQAAEELNRYLEHAFDPNAIGVCYYRLAYMHWHMGNTRLADACYQKALTTRSTQVAPAFIELQMLRLTTGGVPVEPADVESTITGEGIVLAPVNNVIEILVEAAQAATDAEVFPVARSFATLLGMLSGDDVMHDIASSIELDPDW